MDDIERIGEIVREGETRRLMQFVEECKRQVEAARAGDVDAIKWARAVLSKAMKDPEIMQGLPMVVSNFAVELFVAVDDSGSASVAQVKPTLGIPGYLDPNHPRYSPKLAAAIKVWDAMEDENARDGKGPVVAMEKWLSDRWRELGLAHKGAINKTGVSEVARVANWKPEGGTPPTPSK